MKNIRAAFKDGFFEGKYMWFFDNRIQAICKMNIYSHKMKIIAKYNGKERFVVEQIFCYQSRYYLVTRNSAQILMYDCKEQERDLGFRLLKPSGNNQQGGYAAFLVDNNICFFPKSIDENIIYFNIITKKYSEKIFLDSFAKKGIRENNYVIRYLCCYDGIVWAVLFGTKYYIRYDAAGKKSKLIQNANIRIILEDIFSDNYRVKQITDGYVKQQYSRLCIMDNFIAVLPKDNDNVFLIHKSTFELLVIDFPLLKADKIWEGGTNIGRCLEYNEFIYFFPNAIKDLFIYDKCNHNIKKIMMECDNYSESYFVNNKTMLYEDEILGCNELLKYFGQDYFSRNNVGILKENLGKKIWKAIVQ